MTYSYGVSEEYPNADSVTGTNATSDANSATVTVPADATVGYYFWVKATAEKEGCDASEPLFWTQRIISKKLAAPTISAESGKIDRGTVVYIYRPDNATTIHYSVNNGTEQTSTDYSVQLTINEDTEVSAYATGDAPFEKSETVTREFTTVTPTLATPELYPTTDILPGQTLYLNAYGVPENTVLTYSWGVRNGETDIVKNENVVAEGTSATITVPADVKIGYELWVNAQATLDTYNPSEELKFTYTFEGIELSAPTFSLASGENLMPGVETTIYLPANATTLHYTINGGEEQTSEADVTLTINEDMEVVAWATGTGLYTESAEATASYKLEVIPNNVDVLYPTDWSTFSAGDYQYAERGEYTSPKTGITYVFNGAFDVIDGVNTFYFSGADYVLYNTTGKKITGIRLDSPKTSGNYVYVTLSTDAAVTTRGNNDIGFDDASKYSVWFNPQEIKADAQYFCVWSYSGQVSRILVEYDIDTAVKSLNAEEAGEEVYYNLQGVRVANPENGIFIRVQNGKTTKVVK